MNDLTTELNLDLQAIANRIRDRVSRTAYDVGRDLIAARAQCEHGEWLPFLEAAGISETTGRRMMRYAEVIDKSPTFDPSKTLPPVSAVLGKSAKLEDLTDDEMTDRDRAWKRQAEVQATREPAPEPAALEGDIITPTPRKQVIASMQTRIDELENENERLQERIAFMTEDDPGRLAVLEAKDQEIGALRSQLMNEQEKVRRLERQVNRKR